MLHDGRLLQGWTGAGWRAVLTERAREVWRDALPVAEFERARDEAETGAFAVSWWRRVEDVKVRDGLL